MFHEIPQPATTAQLRGRHLCCSLYQWRYAMPTYRMHLVTTEREVLENKHCPVLHSFSEMLHEAAVSVMLTVIPDQQQLHVAERNPIDMSC